MIRTVDISSNDDKTEIRNGDLQTCKKQYSILSNTETQNNKESIFLNP